MNSWSDIGFTLEKTQDGSPTLRRHQATREEFPDGESMHHSGGAWAETLYIYKPVIDQVKEWEIDSPAFLSVGLGLGYVELMIAKELLNQDVKISSYETVTELKEYFLSWLVNQELPQEIQDTYDQVGHFVCDGDKELLQQIKDKLLKLKVQNKWVVDGAFEKAEPKFKHHGFMYDAFSKAVSPQLWDQEFLFETFKKWAAPQSCLSTYSCTGNLKRALKDSGFILNLRQGFKGKRDSTFAVR